MELKKNIIRLCLSKSENHKERKKQEKRRKRRTSRRQDKTTKNRNSITFCLHRKSVHRTSRSIYLSIYLPIYRLALSIYLSICLSWIYLCNHFPVRRKSRTDSLSYGWTEKYAGRHGHLQVYPAPQTQTTKRHAEMAR